MRQVKLANGLLWTANVLVGVGIVIFAFNFLLFAKKSDDLGIELDDGTVGGGKTTPPPRYDGLANIPNPLTKDSGSKVGPNTETVAGFPPGLRMIGSLGTTAFFEASQAQAQADLNGPLIIHEQQRESVVDGWILVSFDSDSATFRDRAGQTQIVRAGAPSGQNFTSTDGRGRKNWSGQPYDPANFKGSRKVSEGGDREMWEIDPEEGEWLGQNFESALGECQYRPNAAGGLEITYIQEGSIGTFRGMKQGDVIKNVNGTPIRSIEDLRAVQAKSGKATTMTLVIDRAGAPYTIVYRIKK